MEHTQCMNDVYCIHSDSGSCYPIQGISTLSFSIHVTLCRVQCKPYRVSCLYYTAVVPWVWDMRDLEYSQLIITRGSGISVYVAIFVRVGSLAVYCQVLYQDFSPFVRPLLLFNASYSSFDIILLTDQLSRFTLDISIDEVYPSCVGYIHPARESVPFSKSIIKSLVFRPFETSLSRQKTVSGLANCNNKQSFGCTHRCV